MSSNKRITRVCEFCGQEFIAKTNVTKYCDHNCAQLAYKQRKREEKKQREIEEDILYNQFQPNDTINNKEILSVMETAELMGVSRYTINRYCKDHIIPCKKINRKIFIRKKDIEALFDITCSYVVKHKENQPIEEYYTVPEIVEIYGFSSSFVYKILKEKNVPKKDNPEHYGRPFYSKRHVDRHFKYLIADQDIEEWYETDEIMAKYQMTKHAVQTLVSKEKVPRKKEGYYVRYSKKHIDDLLIKRIPDPEITSWYTMKDIWEKYKLTQKYVSNLIYKNPIPKIRIGGFTHLSQTHFDNLVKMLDIITEYYTTEEVIGKYNITRDSLNYHLKKNNIKTVKEGKFIKIPKREIDNLFNK